MNVKTSNKLLRLNTFVDDWVILVGSTDDEIAEEISILHSSLKQPLGARASLRAKTAENISLFMEMIKDEPLSNIWDPEDDVCEGGKPLVIERAVKFQKFGAIEYIEYAKE